jgi:hypothetical protein
MQAIWVLENVKGNKSFYSKLELLILVASVCLWKKHHPSHNTTLYCDEMTNQVLGDLKILHLWDEVAPLSYPEKINREVFWSSCKSKIISETQIPIVVVDHDFLIYTNIDEHLKDRVVFTYNEQANTWYPKENNKANRSLSAPIEYVNNLAANVSLLYLPDPEFAREYAKQVLQNHIELSAMYIDDLSPNYMILSEQLMLKQWLSKREIPHQSLCKNIWDCNNIKYTLNEVKNGIWNCKEISRYCKHYGVDKSRFKENLEGFDYEKEIEFLFRCIKSSKLHDVKELKKKIKVIENV